LKKNWEENCEATRAKKLETTPPCLGDFYPAKTLKDRFPPRIICGS
jgi:hypothetical protein